MEDTSIRTLSDITRRLCRCIPCTDCPWHIHTMEYTTSDKLEGKADKCCEGFTNWLIEEVRGEHDNADKVRTKQHYKRS